LYFFLLLAAISALLFDGTDYGGIWAFS